MGFVACALCLWAACAQSGEHASVRSPASSEAEEAPARPIATSLAHDPLSESHNEAQAGAAEHAVSPGTPSHHHHQEAATNYTCPMHPEVQQTGPGECPKCGMRLVPGVKPDAQHAPSAPQAEPAHKHAN